MPERDELAARIERHLTRTVKRHPEHALLLSPYVRWSLLPRARRADPRPAGQRHRIRWAYTRINTCTRLARNAALVALAGVLPAPVLASLLGLHPNTTVRWAGFATKPPGPTASPPEPTACGRTRARMSKTEAPVSSQAETRRTTATDSGTISQ
ncbi:hypothetical protein ACFRQM_24935 [Streptomyces sp. NPDC056831]|uniref:hypothetical protein n=1 Tax=Streptomyces sp. NPDC056831 TaxID=3345954 RepID=UPI0036835CE7